MKILYGVVGEGFGHATRSRTIIEHLSRSHDVLIVASARQADCDELWTEDLQDWQVVEGLRITNLLAEKS